MNNLEFACPNCGSTQVHKSIGGKAEQIAVQGAIKFAKSSLKKNYGVYVLPAMEKQVIDDCPLQYVCDYCHHTFHARRTKIEAGAYSMDKDRADRLTDIYNNKLQIIKDKEFEEIKKKASKKLIPVVIWVLILFVGILICCNCEHTAEGLFGTTIYTGTFVFSCFVIGVGGIGTLISIILCVTKYIKAFNVKSMAIQDYAKKRSAQ